jgi:hypothetical protein
VTPSPVGHYFMTLSADQILRIWDAKAAKSMLLALYLSGQDWVVWTPEGYYAASPGGERLVGFTVDHGIDKGVSYYPAEQFRRQMYRPDVIKLVLEKGSVGAALKSANAALVAKKIAIPRGEASPDKLLPPAVTLQVVDQMKLPRVSVKVVAEKGCTEQPIKSLRLLVDGRPLPNRQAMVAFEEGKEVTQHEATWQAELPPGKHKLSVLARFSVRLLNGPGRPTGGHRTARESRRLPFAVCWAFDTSDSVRRSRQETSSCRSSQAGLPWLRPCRPLACAPPNQSLLVLRLSPYTGKHVVIS